MENVIGAGRKISIKIGPNKIYNSWGAVEAESTDQQINIVNRKIYQAMAGYHACIQHLN